MKGQIKMYDSIYDDFNQENKWSGDSKKKGTSDDTSSITEYEKQTNPKLKEFGKQIVNNKNYNLLKWGIIILAIFVVLFAYMAFNDKFKTEVTCPTITCPSIDIPACPSCPTCPSNNISLKCGDVNFPNSIDVNLNNESS